jgi:septal ring factor EnvC (AmiA/AmiB activator)
MRRRLIIAALAVLAAPGCAITDRIDRTNQEINTTNSQLAVANQQLAGALQRIDETNRRLDVVDQAILQSPLLRPNPAPAAPAPGRPTP